MAQVIFVQTEWFEHLGVLALAAFVRGHGHQPALLIGHDPQKIIPRILDQAPDVVALTATTGAHRAALALAQALRPYYSGKIVMGGPHPTFFPEVLSHPALDAVCRGEGEVPLLMALDRLDTGKPWDNVPGLWVKREGEVIENPLPAVIADLDSLPFPARDLVADADPALAREGMKRILAGRGCPYQCTYCFNKALRELTAGKGPYVRLRGADNVLAEARELRARGAATINFVDDCFGLRREWTREILARWPDEVGLPFIVNLRPEQVDEDMARALGRAGCYCAQMGVESARPWLRSEVLGREVSDEVLEQAARMIKRAGIRLLTYNMVALPGETLDDAAATLAWNARLQVDFPRVSIFQPYPRTVLGDKILGESKADTDSGPAGPDQVSESYFRRSPLPGTEARRIANLHKLFLPYILFPALRTLILALTRLPQNPLFDLIFLLSIFLQYRAATNRTWRETVALGLRNLRAYFT